MASNPVINHMAAREVVRMELQMDLSKEYGIVLEGGGAKGSYQIGAWKALREAGVQIKGVAGASVGSLNGALICMDDLEHAEYIWENITYSKVMDIDDELMDQLKNGRLWDMNLKAVAGNALRLLKEGGLDIAPLKKLIHETVDEEKIRRSGRDLYITTFSVDERKGIVVDVKKLPEGEIEDALLASAYFMAFKNEKLGGKRYIDGGGFNNVPVNVLIDEGYQDIIIIRIYGLGFDTEKVVEIPEGVTVSHIAPRQDLGGILEFDKKKAKRNMLLGYYDAMRLLYGFAGRIYYFDAPQSEAYFFDKMMSEVELVKHYIRPELNETDFEKLEGYRAFTERIFPALAKQMKLKDGWNYKDLYLSVLEAWAKEMRMNRFQIYTPDEIIQKIQVQARKLDSFLPV